MRRREGALRQADDMRLGDLEVVEHVPGVVDGVLLAVHRGALRHVGAGIAAERVGDAAVAAREEAHLRLPAPPVAAVFVDEQDRRAAAGFLVIELHAVGCRRMRHGSPLLRRRWGSATQYARLGRSKNDLRHWSGAPQPQAPKRSSRSSTMGILSSATLAKASRTKRSWPAPNMSPGMVSRFSSSASRLDTSVERWPAKGCST